MSTPVGPSARGIGVDDDDPPAAEAEIEGASRPVQAQHGDARRRDCRTAVVVAVGTGGEREARHESEAEALHGPSIHIVFLRSEA